jgi:hypothetical protein
VIHHLSRVMQSVSLSCAALLAGARPVGQTAAATTPIAPLSNHVRCARLPGAPVAACRLS